jgi:hypothetical protein
MIGGLKCYDSWRVVHPIGGTYTLEVFTALSTLIGAFIPSAAAALELTAR